MSRRSPQFSSSNLRSTLIERHCTGPRTKPLRQESSRTASRANRDYLVPPLPSPPSKGRAKTVCENFTNDPTFGLLKTSGAYSGSASIGVNACLLQMIPTQLRRPYQSLVRSFLGPSVKKWIRGHNDCASKYQQFEILNVHEIDGRFTRHQCLASSFLSKRRPPLKKHISLNPCAIRPSVPMLRDNHHRRAHSNRFKWRIHAFQIVHLRARRRGFNPLGNSSEITDCAYYSSRHELCRVMQVVEQSLGL
jgi:hypothetical protein